MGSASASRGGDSHSDASCDRKEGSDVDVDIMKSDDENESQPRNLASHQSHVTGNGTFEADTSLIENIKDMNIANDADKSFHDQITVTQSIQRELSDSEPGELRETDENPMDLDTELQNELIKPSPSSASAEIKNAAEIERTDERSYGQFSNGESKQKESAFKKERKNKKFLSGFTKVRKSNVKSESSSEEESSSFYKYEKETPVLKGPIIEYSQYKDYVQEYREKYLGYWGLNKILVGYKDEFQKLGKELQSSREKTQTDTIDCVRRSRSRIIDVHQDKKDCRRYLSFFIKSGRL